MFINLGSFPSLTQTLIPAIFGLVGVAVGGGITLFTQKITRKNDRLREQLKEFYSPLLGMRSQIKAKSEVRLKITSMAHELWPRKFEAITGDVEKKRQRDEEESTAYNKLFDYNNTQLVNELVPLYRKMLDHFTDHMWLAEQSTIKHYDALVEYVEVWNRFLGGSLPPDVLRNIEHKEESLFEFYKNLQDNFNRLTRELKDDGSDLWQ